MIPRRIRMKKFLVPLIALAALAVPSAALADDPPVPPAFAPPVVAPVVDVPSANAFAENYASDNARRFLNVRNRRAVRVIDANAACLQSPIVDTRFGCVFTLRALVISRNRGWDSWGHGDSRSHSRSVSHGKRGHHRERFRVRQFGCLGFLRIDGGPAVTPTAQVINVECARIPRGDRTVEEDVTTPA
jgi:hypothetical protein